MTPERYNDTKPTAAMCACGCGLPLDREGRNSKYRFECKKRIEREQAAKYRKQTREKQAVKNARS